MKKYLKFILAAVVLVVLVVLGVWLFQHKTIITQPGKDKFSIDATLKTVDPNQKTLVVSVDKANVTLTDKVGKDITLQFSNEGLVKDKDGKVIQLSDLGPQNKLNIKGTIANGQYIAEYIAGE